ncbi:MAG TPA: diguanylate cyclase [Gallionella sp.]|nr:diguanylate cyclase [Gallionella sp.]
MSQQKITQNRIILVAGLILVTVTILVGLAVFYVMQRNAQILLSNSLQLAQKDNVALVQSEIKQAFQKGMTVATRPFLISQMQLMNTHTNNSSTLDRLNQGAQSFLATGLSAVALLNENGRMLANAGTFVQQPVLKVPINLSGHTQLMFKDKFFLRTELNITKRGRNIGKVVTEAPLPTLSSIIKDTGNFGKTVELVLCSNNGLNMVCFPTALKPDVITLPMKASRADQLPMDYALDGKTGFIVTRDYRHQIVSAAYSPVGDLGLGMVIKIDSSELYAPVFSQLRYLLPLMLIIIAAAIMLLRWQLSPLIIKLVQSERTARQAIMRLQDSESRIRAVLENVDEGIVTISAAGNIQLFNPGAERIFGYSSKDVIDKNIAMLMPEPYRSGHDGYLERYLRTGEARMIGRAREVIGKRSNGEVFPMDLRISEFHLDGIRQFIGTMRDITERKDAEEKILHLAHYDTLTDLPNRRLVQDRIQQTFASARRLKTKFAVMFVDIDNFKKINDHYGHDTGDLFLQMAAQRLTGSLLRADDTVGRQGGDEFIVLLANLSADKDAALVAQKILDALSAPFMINEQEIRSGASIGIAIYPKDGDNVDTLLKNSDAAMYAAKDAGRNNYQFYADNPVQPA